MEPDNRLLQMIHDNADRRIFMIQEHYSIRQKDRKDTPNIYECYWSM